jgi:GT2 family glycosyltransferase
MYNRGLKEISSKYALILTHDTAISNHTLERMVFCMKSHPDIGMVIPSSNLSLGNIIQHRYLKEFMPVHYAANFGVWYDVKNTLEPCVMVKKELLDIAGLLDNRFSTIYYSIYDFCIKTFQSGYRAIINKEAFVYYLNIREYENEELDKDKQLLIDKWGKKGTEFLNNLAITRI